MDYFYRTPLWDLNPYDEEEVINHYSQILNAVKLSSKSLHDKIKPKSYKELFPNEKTSLLAYILRGRYRAVPFGIWAASGVGKWGANFESPEAEIATFIENPIPFSASVKFRLAPQTVHHHNHIYFYSFSEPENKWIQRRLKPNLVLQLIIDHFQRNSFLKIPTFISWFDNSPQEEALDLFEKMLEVKFLISESEYSPLKINIQKHPKSKLQCYNPKLPQQKINVNINSDLILDEKLRSKISTITSEMGNLLELSQTNYLDHFKKHFINEHEDRYVKITDLFIHPSLLKEFLLNPITPSSSHEAENPQLQQIRAHKDKNAIDLSKLTKHAPITQNKFTTLLFTPIFNGSTVLIDHIHTGKPFSLNGRNTIFKTHFKQAWQTFKTIDKNEEGIYADIEVWEKPFNYLTAHKNIAPYCIKIFSQSLTHADIPLERLYIGISHKEFIIFDPYLNKRVIPLIQHCLNPELITHPISRLLVEVAGQFSFNTPFSNFNPNPIFPTLPRVYWRDAVLMPQKWFITNHTKPTDIVDFKKIIGKYPLPKYCLFGNGDTQVVINLDHDPSLQYLLSKVKYKSGFILAEYLPDPEATNPQIGINLINTQYINSQNTFLFNPKIKKDREWYTFDINLCPDDSRYFVAETLYPFFTEHKYRIASWYFLAYQSDKFFIRVRIKFSDPDANSPTLFENQMLRSSVIYSIHRKSYYPEYEKYGSCCIHLSEALFHKEAHFLCTGEFDKIQYDTIPLLDPPLLLCKFISHLACSSIIDEQMEVWIIKLKTNIISQLDHPQKRKFINLKSEIKKEKLTEPHELIIQKYSDFFLSHPFRPNKSKWEILIENHLHMLINRVFLNQQPEFESFIWYLVYSGLLKKKHTNS
ncbi:thiopeptide-type bacteriocin biosynthesis protein [Litoribacter populi]|uniref:thiopeptide-type bacteriocin biosynthesis protein n=1 Tax=Litoribacter populi TaxID=2598460 RepID=UPI00117C7193|nr:thiopeptide-type bacteriocin biosynthesis protein [Litoribacter populi]